MPSPPPSDLLAKAQGIVHAVREHCLASGWGEDVFLHHLACNLVMEREGLLKTPREGEDYDPADCPCLPVVRHLVFPRGGFLSFNLWAWEVGDDHTVLSHKGIVGWDAIVSRFKPDHGIPLDEPHELRTSPDAMVDIFQDEFSKHLNALHYKRRSFLSELTKTVPAAHALYQAASLDQATPHRPTPPPRLRRV